MKKIGTTLFALALGLSCTVFAADPEVGKSAPDFSLKDVDGKIRKLSASRGKYVVLEWFNYNCPFVKKHYETGNMQGLQKTWTGKDVVWLSNNSSAPGKQGHYGAADMKAMAQERNAAATAILLDPDGKVGKTYGAKTTPHMFVIDPKGVLIYQGAIDDKASADPSDVKGAANYVDAALNESMAGKAVSTASTQSYGCSVKYK